MGALHWWLVGLLGVSCAGCAGPAWKQAEVLVDHRFVTVELEQRWDEGVVLDQEFRHPASLDPDLIGAVVGSVRCEIRGFRRQPAHPPVVHEDLLGELSEAIANGLSQADSTQRVRFAVLNPGTTLGIFPTTDSTHGVAFVDRDGFFNVAFDLVKESLVDGDPIWHDPVRYGRTQRELLFSPPLQLARNSDGESRSNWIRAPMDPATLTMSPAEDESPSPPADALTHHPATDEETAAPTPTRIQIPESTKTVASDEASTPPTVFSPTEISAEERLQRLRFLEELYRDGAITQENYERQRAALLGLDP